MMSELAKKLPCSVPLQTKKGEMFGLYSCDFDVGRKDCIVRLFDYLPGWNENSS